jgi:hypothetical protein
MTALCFWEFCSRLRCSRVAIANLYGLPLDCYGFRYDLATGHHSPPGDTQPRCMLLLPPLGSNVMETGIQVLPWSGRVKLYPAPVVFISATTVPSISIWTMPSTQYCEEKR